MALTAAQKRVAGKVTRADGKIVDCRIEGEHRHHRSVDGRDTIEQCQGPAKAAQPAPQPAPTSARRRHVR